MIRVRCGVVGSEHQNSSLFWPVVAYKPLDFDFEKDEDTLLVFTSVRAVESFFMRHTFDEDRVCAAVGPITAETLQKYTDANVLFSCEEQGLAETLTMIKKEGWTKAIVFGARDGVSESIAKMFSDEMNIEIVPVYFLAPSLLKCPIDKDRLKEESVVFECLSGAVFSETSRRLCEWFQVESIQKLPSTLSFDLKTRTAQKAYEKSLRQVR